MRITKHPILEFKRGKPITIFFEGKPIRAYEGETVAAALFAGGIREFIISEKKQRPRGFYCAIGKCSSCLMEVDGMPNVRTCITLAREGMKIKEHKGWATLPLSKEKPSIKPLQARGTDVLVIGGGPAGLKVALACGKVGAKVVLVDENPFLGGQLLKQTHKFFGSQKQWAGIRGIKIGERLTQEIKNCKKIEVMTSSSAVGIYEGEVVGIYRIGGRLEKVLPKAVIITTGAQERMVLFENNDLPGVYGAGGVQTLMNQYGIKPGDNLLMVGAGNVGLIVSYQLLQAGVKVKAVVEAMPKIGGYFVHAAKLRRQGVPILTNHTVIRAEGNNKVERAVIAKLGKEGLVKGSEKTLEVDAVALAVGLSPDYRLLDQAGCELKFVPKLGGWVALRDENLETTRKGIWIAGDTSGVEEATTAMLEGEIAGCSASLRLGFGGKAEKKRIEEAKKELEELRAGPFYVHIREGLKEVVK
jgi:sarcosine oxidase subunit alpha